MFSPFHLLGLGPVGGVCVCVCVTGLEVPDASQAELPMKKLGTLRGIAKRPFVWGPTFLGVYGSMNSLK